MKAEGTTSGGLQKADSLQDRVWNILSWKDPKVSGAVLAVGLIVFILTTIGGYTVLGLSSAALLVHLFVSVIYHAWEKIRDQKPSEEPILKLEISRAASEGFATTLNEIIVWYQNILQAKKIKEALLVAGALLVTYVIGLIFDMYTLVMLVYLGGFILPKVYETNRAKIDDILAKAKAQVDKAINNVTAKVGPETKSADKTQ